MSTNTNGWTLDRVGVPTADIMCPHGHAVDMLNHYDYALNRDQQSYMVGRGDLVAWLQDNAANLAEYCAGH